MKYCVYILKDDNDVFYIGSTNNLERRMSQHKNKYTKTTARMNNPKLVLFQEYNSKAEGRLLYQVKCCTGWAIHNF